ncbi:cobalt-precorrin-6A reductase [Ancylobacter sp. Lp-2]|uniref:cobalt-precorrin-6A reductase n=1 Tax=Ancylobacter sp. Lp-2 TaxID=2881339 RepID=UPI001E4B0235|nr:cobalt-precorrin-6A reductase [Ancylobacter sp. Lp-2]MCB4769504.1 cobalt-precorrin-6A reductase [Ancylobacter sp. Lp-2]
MSRITSRITASASGITAPHHASRPLRVLVLGGTSEARALVEALASRADLAPSVSLAGRTRNPLPYPAPTRIGGFGGAQGLADHLRAEGIDLMVDATHPFAAIMSMNAVEAARLADVPLLALARPAWTPKPGDDWQEEPSLPAALAGLGAAPRRVFAALGRNEVRALEAAPQHHYLIRSVDPVEPPLAVPDAGYILDRGPFILEAEINLFKSHGIEVVLAKNSGGTASAAKLAAARALGLKVVLVARPPRPDVEPAASLSEALAWIDARLIDARLHARSASARRGV